MNIEPKDLLSVALANAITNAVPPEMQSEIFRSALHDHLFAKSRDGGMSAIDAAFQHALDSCLRQQAEKLFAQPEYLAQINEALDQAFQEFKNSGGLSKEIQARLSRMSRY